MQCRKDGQKEKKESKKDKKDSKGAASAGSTEAATSAGGEPPSEGREFMQFEAIQMRMEINELHSKVQDLTRITSNQSSYGHDLRELGHRLDVQKVEGTSTENRLALLAESHMRDAQRISFILSRLTSAEEDIRHLKRRRTDELEAEISRSSNDPPPTLEAAVQVAPSQKSIAN